MSAGEKQPFSRKDVQTILAKTGADVRNILIRRLGVPDASLLLAEDIATSGAAVFAEGEIVVMRPSTYVGELAKAYPREVYEAKGLTTDQFTAIYQNLIGNGDYKQGALAQSLITAQSNLTRQEFETLQRRLADMYACMLFEDTKLAPEPGIRLDLPTNTVVLNGQYRYQPQIPLRTYMEYGPGLAAAHKIPKELTSLHQSILVEGGKSGRYVAQALYTLAGFHGYLNSYPGRFVTREDGIKSATSELLQIGATNFMDVIVASGIHSAGREEIVAGIENAQKILKPGGVFALRANDSESITTLSSREMITTATTVFGKKPELIQPIITRQQTTGKTFSGIAAVFVK